MKSQQLFSLTGNSGPITNANLPQPLLLSDGTESAPALAFINDTNTGIYSVAADRFSLVAGGKAGVEIRLATSGNYTNLGFGGAASLSDSYVMLMQRSLESVPFVAQIANPNTAAFSAAKWQLSCDNGANTGEVGLFTAASALDAYQGRMTVRAADSTVGISIISGDGGTNDVRIYTGGDYGATGRCLQFNADKSIEFMQMIAKPSSPAAGSLKLYLKSDKKLYALDSTGTETALW